MTNESIAENPEFDHLLHWVPDVEAAAAKYTDAGMPAHFGSPDSGFHNGAWRRDERYIEILTITDESLVDQSTFSTGVELLRPAMKALNGRHGAFTFAVNVTDAKETAHRLRSQGHDVQEFEVTFDGGVSFLEVFLVDATRPWMPFFITYTPPRDEIVKQIDPNAFDPGEYDIQGLEISSVDPDLARAELSALLGIEPTDGVIELPGAHINVIGGDREAITAVMLGGKTHPGVEIDGLTFR